MIARLLDHFREQAGFCDAFGSPFTAQLIARMGDDLEAGGPVAALVGDWPANPRADAVALRLAGALHFAVLSGRDPPLAAHYPAQRADWRMDDVWPLARDFLSRERPWAEEFIQSPPQTNETRRAIGLLAGFLTLAKAWDRPIDTLEIGASAGLNLNWDRFFYRTGGWRWGVEGGVEIDTDWRGASPPLAVVPRVRARAACDRNPLDVSNLEERLQLKSYIWPDQRERLARFDAAANLAVAARVHVDRADAVAWLTQKLAARAPEGLTVVYHSVFLQYPPRESRAAIKALIEAEGASATADAPLAWLRFEPEAVLGGPRDSVRMFVDMVTWPGGETRVLAETDGHARWIESRL